MKKHLQLLALLLGLLVPWVTQAQTPLFSEDFEGGSMPTGWTTDGPGTWTVATGDYSSTTGAGQGTYNAKITHGTTGNLTKLITPAIDFTGVSSAVLSYMHIERSWAGDIDELRVYYRNDTIGTWTLLSGQEFTGAVSAWTTEQDIPLPNLSNTYQIAFEFTDRYGYGLGIDNVVILGTQAQTTVTIGTGTVTSNTNPIGTYYNYSITEQLYTADEIGMAGNITSISFYYMGTAAKDLPITVYMDNVSATDLSSGGISLANATEVFSGTLSVPATEGWVSITLDTPFPYDGTSNLLIGIIKDYLYYFTGQTWQGTTTPTTMARYTQNDNNAYTTGTTPGTVQSNRPNIQLTITPSSGPTCERPADLTVSNITTTGATFSWTSTVGNYVFEYKAASADTWTTLPLTSNTTTLTNLQPGTSYDARVKAVCEGGIESGYRTANFMTVYGVPFSESFSTSSVPTNWNRYTGLLSEILGGTSTLASTSSGWSFGTFNGVLDNHTRVNIYGTSCKYWLVTPNISIGNNVQLTFDLALTAYSGTVAVPSTSGTDDKFVVLITTDGGTTWTVLRQWDNAGSSYVYNNITCSATGEIVAIDLSSYAGQSIAVAFYGESTVSNADNNVHIDNVSIDYIPSCLAPDDLTATNVSTNTAYMTWTGGSGTFNVEYKLASADTWTRAVSNVGWNYMLVNLTPATTYDVRVQSVCTGEESSWRTASFTTACGAITTFPWSENFESYASGDFSNPCWVNQHITGSGSYIFKISTSSMGTNSTHQLQLPDMAIGTQTMLRLPEMTLSGNYQFVLDVYRSSSTYNTSYAEEGIRVFASANGSLDSATEITFIPRHYQVSSTLIPAEDETGWYTYTLPIPITTGTCYIILRGESQYCTPTYMDNFVVELAPACPTPTQLAVNYTGGNSAQVSWTSDATSWNINVNGVVTNNVTANPYTLTGLNFGTTYTIQVQANCNGDISEWTTPVSFTTDLCDIINQCALTITITDAYGDGGGQIQVVDTVTNTVLGTYTNSSYSTTYTLNVCNGRTLNFVFASTDSWSYENGWVITDINEEVVSSHEGCTSSGACDAPTNGVVATYTVDCTVSSCRRPTALAASEVGSRSVQLGWTENGEATSWVVAYAPAGDTVFTEVAAATNPYTLTGLNPATAYTVKVRPVCSDQLIRWSDPISFTTDVACPAPTSLAVTPGTTVADVNWNGNANNYTLQYTQVPTGTPSTGDSIVLSYDDGSYASGIGNSTAANWTWGVMYPASMYMGGNLTKVSVFETASFNDSTYTVKIYSGGTTAPDSLLASQVVTPMGSDGFHEITLTTPVTIDFAQNLWIVVEAYGTYVMSSCNSTNPNNTWVYDNGSWGLLADLVSSLAGRGWMIRAQINPFDLDALTWTTVNNATAPASLTGLTAETDYITRVKALCGGQDGESAWETSLFTTLESNPIPMDVVVTPAATRAAISWRGYSDSYKVYYRTAEAENVVFSEGFESDIDTTLWKIYTVGEAPQTDGWYTYNPESGLSFSAHGGSMVASAWSWNNSAYNADNWLVTPQVTLGGTLKYWERTAANWPDHYEVIVSTTGNTVADFANGTVIRARATAATTGDWNEVTLDLSAFSGQAGYIAFHHADTDANYLLIDDIRVIDSITPAGAWVEVPTTATNVTLTGLTPETTYDYKVTGIVNNVENVGTDIAQFTTDTQAFCPAPVLTMGEFQNRTASFSWTCPGDSVFVTLYNHNGQQVWGQFFGPNDTAVNNMYFPETQYPFGYVYIYAVGICGDIADSNLSWAYDGFAVTCDTTDQCTVTYVLHGQNGWQGGVLDVFDTVSGAIVSSLTLPADLDTHTTTYQLCTDRVYRVAFRDGTGAGQSSFSNVAFEIVGPFGNTYFSASNPDTGTLGYFTHSCTAEPECWPMPLVIGNENSTTTSYNTPVNNYYNYTLSETIIDQSEIGGAMPINGIRYYFNYASPMTSKTNCTIYLQPTTKTAFSSSSDLEMLSDNAVMVYTGALNCSQGWNEFTFDTPYQYDGTSNLMVIVDDNSGSYNSSSHTFRTSSCTGYKTLYWYSDSENPDPTNGTFSGSKSYLQSRVVMALVTCDTATCHAPVVAEATTVGANNATVAWTNSNAAAYSVTLMSGSSVVSYNTTVDTTYTFTGLTANSDYSVEIRALCSATDSSTAITANFHTECDMLATLPYTYGFEDATTGSTSNAVFTVDCWKRHNNATGSYKYPFVSSSTCHTGTRSLYWYSSTSTTATYGNYQIAVLPGVGGNYTMSGIRLKFWSKVTTATYRPVFYVGVMTDPNDYTTFVPTDTIAVNTDGNTNYNEYTAYFYGYNGTGRYVAIAAQRPATSTWYAYMDDITLEELPSCVEVVSVDATNITSSSAVLTWVDNYNTSATYTVSDASGVIASGITGNSYTVTGLNPGTQYTFNVTAICSATETTQPVSVTFYTACVALTAADLPYTEDFEAYGSGSAYGINPCWTKGTNNSTAYPYPTSTAASGTRSLYFYGNKPSSATGTRYYSYAALPELASTIDASSLTLAFKARRYSSTTATYRSIIYVGVMTDPTDVTTFTAVDTINMTPLAASAIESYRVDLTNYTGNGKYVAFYCPPVDTSVATVATYNYIYIDDVELDFTPSCSPVNDLMASNITASTATLSWTSTNTNATYIVSDATGVIASGITGTTYTVTGLPSNTLCTLSVAAICSANDTAPAVSVTFRTACGTISLPYTTSFEPEDLQGTTNALALPWCSYRYYVLGTTTSYTYYPYSYNSTTYAHTGSRALYFYGTTSTAYPDSMTFILPAVDVQTYPMNGNRIKFYARSSSTSYNKEVYVGTMTDPTDPSTFSNVGQVTVSGTTHTLYEVRLTNASATAPYVYLMVRRGSGTIYIDDLILEELPTCLEVTNLAAAAATDNSITLTWADASNTGATYTVSDGSSVIASGITGTTYTVTGLTANTEYTFYVTANCSATDASTATSFTARTACAAEAFPFYEDFSANLSSNVCWRGATGTSAAQAFAGTQLNLTTPQWSYASSVRDGLPAGHYYKNIYGSSTSQLCWMITPTIDLSNATSAQLEFDVALTAYNNAALPNANGDTNTSQAFMVIVSTDGGNTWSANNATVWQNGTGDYTYASLADTVYQHKTISLNQYVGGTVKIAFYTQSLWSGGDNDLHLDNIAVTGDTAVPCVVMNPMIGDSTSTTTAYLYPVNNYYNYTLSETIIDASEIGGPMDINSISYYYNYATAMTNKSNCTIYVQPTSKTVFSSSSDLELLDLENAVMVYSGDLNCSQGWNTFTFTTPFNYDGVGNLMVIVDDNSGSYNSSSHTFRTTSCTGYKTLYWYNDSYNPDPTSSTYSGSKGYAQYRVVMKLDGCQGTAPSCLVPTNLAVTAGINNATLTWVDSAAASLYSVTLSDANGVVSYATTTTPSYTLTGLTGNTDYNVAVRALCSASDSSRAVTAAFHTECDLMTTLPYSYGFEGDATGGSTNATFAAECWRRLNNATQYFGYPYIASTASYCHTGSRSTYWYVNTTTGTYGDYQCLVLPGVNTTTYPINTLRLKFWTKGSAATARNFLVGVMTDPTDINTFTTVETVTVNSTDWVEHTVVLDSYTGTGAYVAIRQNRATSSYTTYIDDITLEVAPTCVEPAGVTVDNITTNSAVVSWTGTANGYTVAYGTGTNPDSMATVSVTGNSTTLTGLMPNTAYNVYVKAVCSATDQSPWTNATTFRTNCATFTTPYTWTFEDMPVSTAPLCWTKVGNGITNVLSSTSASHNSTQYLRFSGSTSNLILLPEMASAVNTLQMRLWTRPESTTNSSCGTFSVGYVTDASDASTFVALETYTYNSFSAYDEKTVVFASAPAGARMALRHNPTNTSWYWYVDDVTVEAVPSCLPVTNLAAAAAINSVALTWSDANTGATYTVSDANGTIASGITATTYTVTGLTANTDYTFFVTANCSATLSSEPVSVTTHTQCAAVAFPFTEGFESGALSTCWSIDGPGTWSVSTGDYSSTTGAHTGTYNVKTTHGTTGNATKLITPVIDFTGVATAELKFWHLQREWGGDQDELRVYYRTSATDTWHQLAAYTSDIQTYTQETITLPNLSSTYQVAFEFTDGYGYGVAIDDISIDLPPACSPVTNLAAAATANSATLTWSDANTGATYTVSDANGTIATGITDTFYTVTGLTANTDYTFFVTANCSATLSSEPVSVTTHTQCAAVAFPFAEGFESGALSNCWSIDGPGTWIVGTGDYTLSTGAHTGTYNAKINHGTTGNVTKLITPAIDMTGVSVAELRFWHLQRSWSGDQDELRVYYRTSTTDTWHQLAAYTDNITAYTEEIIPLTNLSSTFQVAFEFTDGYGYGVALDDISIDLPPSCMAVTALTATPTDSSVVLNWSDANTGATYTVYDMSDSTVIATGITATTYTVTGLTANTLYTFGVVANCSATDASQFTSVAVRTNCATFTAPYTWTFEDMPVSAAPLCWTKVGNGTTNVMSSDSYAHNSTKYLRFSGSTSNLIVLPEINGTLSDLQMRLWTRPESTSNSSCGTFSVGYVTDIADATTFVALATYSYNDFTDYDEKTVVFASAPAGARMAMRHNATSTSWYWYVDDVTVEEIPSCMPVTSVAVTGVTLNSVSLSWNSVAGAASYIVYNMADTSVVAATVTDTFYTVTGLTAETNYTFGVKSRCSATDVTPIFATVDAFTGYCQPNPTSVDAQGITSVAFGSLTNDAARPSGAGYRNYSNLSGMVATGSPVTVDIVYATGYSYGTIIWVDWNNSLTFDSNEVVYVGTSTEANPDTLSCTFNLPADQALGSYRMRILGADSYFDSYTGSIAAAAGANPCASYSWGVAEDYTLTLVAPTTCPIVDGVTVTGVTNNSVSLSWNSVTGATYTLYNDVTVVATGITDTFYTVTSLTANTDYTFGVVANCSATEASAYPATVSARTLCENVNIPFVETFEATSATRNCWTLDAPSSANAISFEPFDGHTAMQFSSYETATDYNQYAYSPVFNTPSTGDSLHVRVRYATYSTNDSLWFGVRLANMSDFVWMPTAFTTMGQNDIAYLEANLPINTVQLAVHYYGNYSYYAWIDSVEVSVYTPGCQTTYGFDTVVACDSTVWNGNTYTQGGTYSATLTNAAGCDSVVTLNLTINNSVTVADTASAIDSYLWHGNTYTVSGDYVDSLTTLAGCDSICTLHLTVTYSALVDIDSVTACDSYTWRGTTYTASTVATDTVHNASGADSIYMLILTVNYSQLVNDTVTACDSYLWHGVTYTANATAADTLTTVAGCDSICTLTLTVNHSTTGTDLLTGCDSILWNDTWYTASTIVYDSLETTEGCDSIVAVTLLVNQSVTTTETVTSCDSYEWNGTVYTASTLDTLVFAAFNGCDSNVVLDLTINYSSETIDTVSAIDNYTWRGTLYDRTGLYSDTLTGFNGCDSILTLDLTISGYSADVIDTVEACDSAFWHGRTYYASTVDRDTIGTDVYMLLLTINHSTYDTVSVTARFQYEWHDSIYTQSGIYNYYGQTAAGCDHVETLILTIDTTVEVYYSVAVVVANTEGLLNVGGTVEGEGSYLAGTEVTLTATPDSGYLFNGWYTRAATGFGGELLESDSIYTITLDEDVVLVAMFERIGSNSALLTVAVDTALGQVLFNGMEVPYNIYRGTLGDEVTLTAVAINNSTFLGWVNAVGDTLSRDEVYTVTLDQTTMSLTAAFRAYIGIDDVVASEVEILAQPSGVLVRGAAQQEIMVFDVVGRLMGRVSTATDEQFIRLPQTGVYLVKVADLPAKRVLVRE